MHLSSIFGEVHNAMFYEFLLALFSEKYNSSLVRLEINQGSSVSQHKV